MCHSCVQTAAADAPLPETGQCHWCNGKIGVRTGLLRRNLRAAALVVDKDILCNQCFDLMQDIVRERLAGSTT